MSDDVMTPEQKEKFLAYQKVLLADIRKRELGTMLIKSKGIVTKRIRIKLREFDILSKEGVLHG